MAVRESVINAITHGNQNDDRKRVHVEFAPLDDDVGPGIAIRVLDEGSGFDPESLPDCRTPENILKSSGRGIFLIRSFMDELVLQRAQEGGMEVVMVKRGAASAGVIAGSCFSRDSYRNCQTGRGDPARATRVWLSRFEESRERSRHRGGSRVRAHVPRGDCGTFSGTRHPGGGARCLHIAGPWLAVALGVRSPRRHHELCPRPADLLRVARARVRWPCGRRRRL